MKKLVEGIHGFQREDFAQDQDLFKELEGGQSPPVLFITCSDSRIVPSLLTRSKPGDLFIQRTAGNIVPPYGAVMGGEAATIEYAVAALKVQDIIICGHSHCGAMGGLLNPDAVEKLPAVKAYLEHAESTRRIIEENYSDLTDPAMRLKLAIEENVLVQLENLKTHPAVAAAIGRDALRLHGWVYKFETGDVHVFDSAQHQFVNLEADAPPVPGPVRTTRTA